MTDPRRKYFNADQIEEMDGGVARQLDGMEPPVADIISECGHPLTVNDLEAHCVLTAGHAGSHHYGWTALTYRQAERSMVERNAVKTIAEREVRHLRNENANLCTDLGAALKVIDELRRQRDTMPDRIRALPWGRWCMDLGVGNLDDIKSEVLNCCAAEVSSG